MSVSWVESGSKKMKPVVLEGRFVLVRPMKVEDLPALTQVGCDDRLWQWNPTYASMDPEKMNHLVQQAMKAWEEGHQLPFVVEDKATGKLIGSSRYIDPSETHRRLEIGATWVVPERQKTKVNPETKYLLLGHAFETLGCQRVEFKTDSLNEASRGALLKLGATFEGIFRNHMLTSTGRKRHSAYYSITVEEWPTVKVELEKRLEK